MGNVQVLLEIKADPNKGWSKNNQTPLNRASFHGHFKVVQVLVRAMADVNVADEDNGQTPLWLASRYGHGDIVKELLASRANVGAVDRGSNQTSLWVAVHQNLLPIIKLLVAARVNVDIAMVGNNQTPLWLAACYGRDKIVETLIAAEADPTIMGTHVGNDRSYTCKEIAQENNQPEVVELLEEYENRWLQYRRIGNLLQAKLEDIGIPRIDAEAWSMTNVIRGPTLSRFGKKRNGGGPACAAGDEPSDSCSHPPPTPKPIEIDSTSGDKSGDEVSTPDDQNQSSFWNCYKNYKRSG